MAITYELCSNDEDMESAYKIIIDSFTEDSVTFQPSKMDFMDYYKNSNILIAKDDGKVVACVVFDVGEDKVLRCPGAAVLKEYRKKHMFTNMLDYGHYGPGRIFRQKGATKVLIMVDLNRKKEAEEGYLKNRNLTWVGVKKFKGVLFHMYYRDLND